MTSLPPYRDFLATACRAAYCGGLEILSVHRDLAKGPLFELKDDNSPVTLADIRSNRAIVDYLKAAKPTYPIISEEHPLPTFDIRKSWERFWLIDPLDGTTEFINQSADYGVMVALIENSCPVLGAIFFPLYDDLYFGALGEGAYKLAKCTETLKEPLDVAVVLERAISLPLKTSLNCYTFLQSKSHLSQNDIDYYNKLKREKKQVEAVQIGSCLKFAYLCEGKANEYSRFSEVHEWDVAAGQAIIESAGGNFKSLQGQPLQYNSKELIIKGFRATF